jgi:hypothetical protein
MPFTIEQFRDLVREAQVRTEARLIALTEAQERTGAQLSILSTQVARLTQSVYALTDWVGELKGITTEIEYRTKARAYFGRLLRRPQVLSPGEVASLLDDAVEAGILPEDHADDIALEISWCEENINTTELTSTCSSRSPGAWALTTSNGPRGERLGSPNSALR